VIKKPQYRGGQGPIWAVAPQVEEEKDFVDIIPDD
jgi:hypothetical protein